MKKYLKMIRNIVFYLGIYLLMQVMGGIVFAVGYGVTHIGTQAADLQKDMQQAIMGNMYIVVAVTSIISLLIYMFALRNKQQNLWERCSFKKIGLSQVWRIVLVSIFLGAFSCSFVYFMSSRIDSYKKVSESLSGAHNSIISMLCIIIMAPIFEEILFRGLIFNELKKATNIIIALILQALIFATVHGNLLQGMYAFILGLVLGLLYLFTKSIWSNILCHIVYNLCGTLVFPVALYYTKSFALVYMVVGLVGAIAIVFFMYKRYRSSSNLTIGL